MISMYKVTGKNDMDELKNLITEHYENTKSNTAKTILDNWDEEVTKFVKVVPNDYKKIMDVLDSESKKGTDKEEALLIAFEAVTGKKVARLNKEAE